ncbi:DUF4296 domain-containing protein [uncultured Nonlabens sp.]|uniref:DUF4296 domain-containing protein n=1 Tax=uncultured Nonlabens sp. TaxID=859306 RepID=UPI00260523B5|nr:DUF4296 domain-containing protein [uncultured Nonlabens sp.]
MKKITALFLILFILSCSNVEKSVAPDNLFDQDKMAAIITDLYIVEGAISSNRAAFIKKGVQPSSYLFNKYNMDSISFQENLNYYSDRVEEYMLVIKKVQDNLKVLQDSVNSRQERINKEQENLIPKSKIDKDSKKQRVKNIEEEL